MDLEPPSGACQVSSTEMEGPGGAIEATWHADASGRNWTVRPTSVDRVDVHCADRATAQKVVDGTTFTG